MANQHFSNKGDVARLEAIGSAAYDISINGSDSQFWKVTGKAMGWDIQKKMSQKLGTCRILLEIPIDSKAILRPLMLKHPNVKIPQATNWCTDASWDGKRDGSMSRDLLRALKFIGFLLRLIISFRDLGEFIEWHSLETSPYLQTLVICREKPWFSGFQAKLEKLLGPMNMTVWLGDEPIMAISIQLSPMVEVQLVADKAEWFEYNKVPFSNLVAGEKTGLGRDEVHENLKYFFRNHPEARYVARIAKALFTPIVKDLPKRPWSLILTHMVYREWMQQNKSKTTKTDFGGVDLLRRLLRDIGSYGYHSGRSSAGMVARWAKNELGKDDKKVVQEALICWRDVITEIGDKRLGKTKSTSVDDNQHQPVGVAKVHQCLILCDFGAIMGNLLCTNLQPITPKWRI